MDATLKTKSHVMHEKIFEKIWFLIILKNVKIIWVDFLNALASNDCFTHRTYFSSLLTESPNCRVTHVSILNKSNLYRQTQDWLFSLTVFVESFSLTILFAHRVRSENKQKFVKIVTERTHWAQQSSKCKHNLPRQSLSNDQYGFKQPNKYLMYIVRVLNGFSVQFCESKLIWMRCTKSENRLGCWMVPLSEPKSKTNHFQIRMNYES